MTSAVASTTSPSQTEAFLMDRLSLGQILVPVSAFDGSDRLTIKETFEILKGHITVNTFRTHIMVAITTIQELNNPIWRFGIYLNDSQGSYHYKGGFWTIEGAANHLATLQKEHGLGLYNEIVLEP